MALKRVVLMLGHGNTTFGSELEGIGKSLFRFKWGGVFSADTLPNTLDPKKYYIANVDNADQEGSHWVAIHDGYIYDSFGRSAKEMNPNFTRHCLKRTDDDQEQSYNQTNCGQRSLAFLIVCKSHGIKIAKNI
jgi:hypothetical protein